jgi:xylan 1,4-beta-xylosidase
MRDENGKLYLIWKEDGNSVKKPTPIWAMEMNEARTSLSGNKTMLFQNDQPWERNLVEGVSMVKHGEWFYAFYAAAGCCGNGCDYVTAVARSKKLLGPWEKYDKNPLLASGTDWVCPGHGTPVEKDGRFYFLYHAYNKQTHTATGREGLLIEYKVTNDGWIEFEKNNIASKPQSFDVKENFKEDELNVQWQTSVFQKTKRQLSDGKLILAALPESSGRFVGRAIISGNYTATVKLITKQSNASAGISAIGDEKNTLTLFYYNGMLTLTELKRGKEKIITSKAISITDKVWLRLQSAGGKQYVFLYAANGKTFLPLNEQPFDGSFLPPWDRAVRVGVTAKGEEGKIAAFDDFEIKYSPTTLNNPDSK